MPNTQKRKKAKRNKKKTKRLRGGREPSAEAGPTSVLNKVVSANLSGLTDKTQPSATEVEEYTLKYEKGIIIGKFDGDYSDDWNFSKAPNACNFTKINNRTFGRADGGTASNNPKCNCIFMKYISRGNGYIRSRIGTFNNNGGARDTNGMIIGLISNFDLTNENIKENDFIYGIKCGIDVNGHRTYSTIVDRVTTLNALTPTYAGDNNAGNDHLECTIDGSTVKIQVYEGGSQTPTILHTENYILMKKLYPAMIFFGKREDASFLSVKTTPSSLSSTFEITEKEKGKITEKVNEGVEISNELKTKLTELEGLESTEYLAYTNSKNSSITIGKETTYIDLHALDYSKTLNVVLNDEQAEDFYTNFNATFEKKEMNPKKLAYLSAHLPLNFFEAVFSSNNLTEVTFKHKNFKGQTIENIDGIKFEFAKGEDSE